MALRVKINPEKVPDRNQPLSIHKLSVSRSDAPILREVTFDLPQGEILGITGANGAGKTTLVSMLAGTLDVPEKNVSYEQMLHDGIDLYDMSPQERYRSGVHCVFEGRKLFPEMTVEENLRVAMNFRNRGKAKGRIRELVDLFPKLDELLPKKAKDCSGGQQQVVAIARSIMEYPSVLILDEPTLGLSPRAIAGVAEVLKILSSGSVSILICEQRASFVNEVSHRRLHLKDGRVSEPIGEAIRASEWKPQITQPVKPDAPLVSPDDDDDEWKPL